MLYAFQKIPVPLFLLMVLVMSACVKAKRPPQTVLVEKKVQPSKLQTSLEKPISKSSQPAEQKQALLDAPKDKASAKDFPLDPRLDAVIQQFQKGIRFLKQDEVKKATSLFETLRNDHPGVSVFHLNLGVAYKRLARFEDATHSYRQAISIAAQSAGGGYAEAYYNLAIVLREQGSFKDAEAAYLRAITIDPDFQDAHFNLAVLYDLYLNEPVRAIHHYRRHIAIKGKPDEEINIWIAALENRQKVGKGQ